MQKLGKFSVARSSILVTLAALLLAVTATPKLAEAQLWSKKSKSERKAEIRTNARKALSDLYKMQPSARSVIEKAAGYGVFSSFGTKIMVVGGASGKGVVIDNASKKETFMKMLQVGGGVGIGIQDLRLVFVFENKKSMNDFVSQGWEVGGTASGAAKYGDSGVALDQAISVSPGVWVYQLTEKGLAADAMVKGTKYSKDGDLN